MKKILIASIVAGVAALGTPAHAHPNYHYAGGCGFGTLSDGTDNDQTVWTGEIHAAVVATDSSGQVPAAANISVECWVYVNGSNGSVHLSASGFTAAANASTYTFTGPSTDVVTVCEVVTISGTFGTETETDCDNATTTPIIPQPVQDILANFWNIVDPPVCAEIAKHQPGIPPVVEIDSEGDVTVGGFVVYDCPIYGS